MRKLNSDKPWWVTLDYSIFGSEGEGDGSGSGEGAGGAGEGAREGEGEGQGGAGTGGAGDGATDDASGLKTALERERRDKKALEKELKLLRKGKQDQDDAEKTEIQRLTDHSTRQSEKVTKLAAKFKQSAVEAAVRKAAGNAKFLDPSDALRPDVLSAIGVEQDEDDPSEVTIDEASVVKAVTALAKAKPHWVQPTEKKTTKPKSGSGFGGSTITQPQPDEAKAELIRKFPALQGRI